jgi:hypothetical protein
MAYTKIGKANHIMYPDPSGGVMTSNNQWGQNYMFQNALNTAGTWYDFIGSLVWEDDGTHSVGYVSGSGDSSRIWFYTGSGPVTNSTSNAATSIRVSLLTTTTVSSRVVADTADANAAYYTITGGTDLIGDDEWVGLKGNWTGTKSSIASGTRLAVQVKLTTKGGANALNVAMKRGSGGSSAHGPMIQYYSGASYASSPPAGSPVIYIVATDGTLGWFYGSCPSGQKGSTTATINYNTGSTHDEYGTLFRVPFNCKVSGLWVAYGHLTSSAGVLSLYSDPEGACTLIDSVSFLSTEMNDPTSETYCNFSMHLLSQVRTLTTGTDYAVGLRTTTASPNSLYIFDYHIPVSGCRVAICSEATYLKGANRDNNTGSFHDTTSTQFWQMGVCITSIDTVTGAEGGGRLVGPSNLIG